ncbi:uncharacterized protein KY384_002599 [Bacidia gigantensis]|uniref:uncharacterized protein n=1 Tax=Bacidia gigantensis TaxID=2732470 RepID=UPI001D036439|nr:uncharacterized protein KY384_002599 [Bacidia gigantensis]KAG8532722.1 hypothetical protein KY384_002599 [Bacidia gigantensis]
MGRKPGKRELDSNRDEEKSTQRPVHSSSGSRSDAHNINGQGRSGIAPPVPSPDLASHDSGKLFDTEASLDVVGRGVKHLVQTVQALRQLGVENLDLPLPKVVVVGNQSTGKSSLIESMSEIKVMRESGTCTRCPLEINLSEQNSWKCTVSLSKKYLYLGDRHGKGFPKSQGATKDRPLGPWVAQDLENIHFATIRSKDHVHGVLYRAQLANLNPGKDHADYMPENALPPHAFQVKFSPNVIRLNIAGPGLPNLSFYDLPGIINVSDVPEESYLVDLVRNLVKEYIQSTESLVLLALPITDDPANSSAARLIRESKAEARTIGCITKPDLLQLQESFEQWSQILEGRKFRLGFGYFVIKNNPDTNISHAQARHEEEDFFDKNEPWAGSLQAYSKRFGTPALLTNLAQLLTFQIQKSLPRFRIQVREKVEDIENKLRELPQAMGGNVSAIVMGELMKFEKLLHNHLDGGSKKFPFPQQWNEYAIGFRKALESTRPLLKFSEGQRSIAKQAPETPNGSSQRESKATPSSTNSTKTISICIDSDDDVPQNPNTRKRVHTPDEFAPTKSPRIDLAGSANLDSVAITGKCFTLAEVRSIISYAYSGIPGEIHPHATEDMVRQSISHWQHPLEAFLFNTSQLCQNMVFGRVSEAFGQHQDTDYYRLILSTFDKFFRQACKDQEELAMRMLKWESAKPMTLNEEAMQTAYEKASSNLFSFRLQQRAKHHVSEQEAKTGKHTSGSAFWDKVAKVNESTLEPEKYSREIQAMSRVKAYYECGLNSFADHMCASIYGELFEKCRSELCALLKEELGITHVDANDKLAPLLAANPEVEKYRAQLLKEQRTLMQAQQRLEELA